MYWTLNANFNWNNSLHFFFPIMRKFYYNFPVWFINIFCVKKKRKKKQNIFIKMFEQKCKLWCKILRAKYFTPIIEWVSCICVDISWCISVWISGNAKESIALIFSSFFVKFLKSTDFSNKKSQHRRQFSALSLSLSLAVVFFFI